MPMSPSGRKVSRRQLFAYPLAVTLLVLCFGTMAAGSAPAAGAQAEPDELPPVVLDRRLSGAAAIDALGDRLGAVAKQNRKTAAELTKLLRSDPTAAIDKRGQLLFVDNFLPPTKPAPAPVSQAGPYPYSQTFLLHSRPGATRVMYLDFNGHVVSGTAWNDSGVSTAAQPPFDTDGNPASFSNGEQDVIQGVWQRVAEDYAPFNVDVTTEQPSLDAIRRSSASDTQFGTRVLISPSTQAAGALCGSGCGGIAYVGVYDSIDPDHSYYQPAWVFPHLLGNSEKSIAEATSHEAGHNLGLSHDGTSTVGYYQGHGAWAPIMGVGYSRPIVQWSRGEYSDASNTEDDLAVIQSNGAPLRTDDVGGTIGTATGLGSGGAGSTLSGAGAVAIRTDLDVFSFSQTCSGTTKFDVIPAPNSPNLDIRLRVLNSGGTQLAAADPTSAFVTADVASGLSASASVSLSNGTYYVEVNGINALNPLNTGYSDYGSLGTYTLQVRPCAPVNSLSGIVRDSGGNPLEDALVTVQGTALPPASTSATGAYSFPTVTPGTYTVRAERICKDPHSRSVTVNGPTTADFTLPTPGGAHCDVVAHSWISAPTVLPLAGDDAATSVNLPFAYRHYGVDYTTAHVSTNGTVNFLGQNSAFANTAIPNAAAPNAAIYAFWDDILVDGSASVRTATLGSAPNRTFVIEWRNVTLVDDPTRRFDFEVILAENTNTRLKLQYRGISASTAETGTSATLGRENAAGDSAVQFSFNQGLVYDGLAVNAPK